MASETSVQAHTPTGVPPVSSCDALHGQELRQQEGCHQVQPWTLASTTVSLTDLPQGRRAASPLGGSQPLHLHTRNPAVPLGDKAQRGSESHFPPQWEPFLYSGLPQGFPYRNAKRKNSWPTGGELKGLPPNVTAPERDVMVFSGSKSVVTKIGGCR